MVERSTLLTTFKLGSPMVVVEHSEALFVWNRMHCSQWRACGFDLDLPVAGSLGFPVGENVLLRGKTEMPV